MVRYTFIAATAILALSSGGAGDQLFKLLPDDGAADDRFGESVGVSGTIAIVGAWQNDDNGSNSGSAYLFDTMTGRQLFKLLADDGTESGSAYLFDITTGEQIAKLGAEDGEVGDAFAFRVAIGDDSAVVESPFDTDNGNDSGSAYLFDAAYGPCPGDFDGDSSVGVSDLLALLGNWGPCP